ncbi:outer membrane lipoprotein-sorting protein [candidate division KSB1 bacterium]|nr:outer membrane lipoprotein-sorting protein [candidate division KSB1 bacterium]
MKILNIILLVLLLVFAFTKESFCRSTFLPGNTSGDEAMTVPGIVKGMEETAKSYNQMLQNLRVKQSIALKSNVLGEAKITKIIHFKRPDIIEEKILEQEKKVQSGVQMNIDDSVSCAWFIEPLIPPLSLDDYHIRLTGKETINGRAVYVIKVKPKNKQENSIKGNLWIDAQDLVPIKYEGKPLKKNDDSESTKGKQTIEYEKINDKYWLPVVNRREASWVLMIRIVTETTFSGYEVNIDSSE